MPPKTIPKAKAKTKDNDKKIYWKTLRHAGVLFPPNYSPHSIPIKYKGVKVKLTPSQEEIATLYASLLVPSSTPATLKVANSKVLRDNFWQDFKKALGKDHVIKDLQGCDFSAISQYIESEKERVKNLSKDEKTAIKATKDAKDAIYKIAYVDGKEQQVGNYRVEPPGLFRGRGEHPKLGTVKKRVCPPDIVINIGKGEPIPTHPYKSKWKQVIHDPTVSWLAKWNDTVNTRDIKYVWLGATSDVKASSDMDKYQLSKDLKKIIERVRKEYQADFSAKDLQTRQMATALYLIDRLALRAGHEKSEDEADTVGTCTLKVQNVELLDDNMMRLDFLGKDSIRYENTVKVDPRVYKNIKLFIKGKNPSALLFDKFDATHLNKELKKIMPGLSAKVFRTYNASSTLDRLLNNSSTSLSKGSKINKTAAATITTAAKLKTHLVAQKKALYDTANKQVAILCNHQRAVPKGHAGQIEKIRDKISEKKAEIKALKGDAKADKKIERINDAIEKLIVQIDKKEDMKDIALGTSKINYLDPRITIAWCKRSEMPIEKVFTKTLLNKFNWAMDVSMGYVF